MTYEEARRQLPVLEHTAYLNAGTTGPLAQSTADAVIEATERDAREGRSGKRYVERMLEAVIAQHDIGRRAGDVDGRGE